MTAKLRNAFTLVELLVVIAIIGLLAAIVVPAVGAAREAARRTVCLKNMKSIGEAMVSHATKKDNYPGRIEGLLLPDPTDPTNPNKSINFPISWFVKVLPDLGRNDIMDVYFGIAQGTIPAPYVEIAACPSEPQADKTQPWLSYACNSGVFDLPSAPQSSPGKFDLAANGVCHNLFLDKAKGEKVSMSYVSSKDGASNTLLITENVNAAKWLIKFNGNPANEDLVHAPNGPGNTPTGSANQLENRLGVIWDATELNGNLQNFINTRIELDANPSNNNLTPPQFARPSSRHRDGVNAIFCDGSGRFLSREMDYRVYAHIMTPNGNGTAAAFNQLQMTPIPVFTSVLSEGDLQ